MTAERPDRGAPSRTGRHRPVPDGPRRPRARRTPEPVPTGDPGPTRRLREPSQRRAAPEPPESGEPRGRSDDREQTRTADDTPRRVRLAWPDRFLRGLAGVLAGGMVVLALGITAVWFGADRYGLPGPGADVVIGHLVGAAIAVVGQRVADRRPDRTGTIAAVVVVLLVAFVLGFAWFL